MQQSDSGPEVRVLLFKDYVGIEQVEVKSGKRLLLADIPYLFIDNPLLHLNADTLTFVARSELQTEYQDERLFFSHQKFFYKYAFADNHLHVYQTQTIEENRSDSVVVTSTKFDQAGKVLSVERTSFPFQGSQRSKKEIRYVGIDSIPPRFYSESAVVKGKQAISWRGNIYLLEGTDTTQLTYLPAPDFDPKYGSGYYQPAIHPSGDWVVFRILPPFNSFDPAMLFRLDLTTDPPYRVEEFKKGQFGYPCFSPDGNHLLFTRNGRALQEEGWTRDIYVMDLSTGKFEMVGDGHLGVFRF